MSLQIALSHDLLAEPARRRAGHPVGTRTRAAAADAAGPPDARHREQHSRGLGVHQRAGACERSGADRARPHGPQPRLDAGGWRAFDRYSETIEVAGGDAVKLDVRWTILGPVLGADYKGRLGAYAWTAHSAERLAVAAAARVCALHRRGARSGQRAGHTGAEHDFVADRNGRIAWTIHETLPRLNRPERPAAGIVGRRLARLERLAGAGRHTVDCRPGGGRLWTANARVVDGSMLAVLGDGNYDVGARRARSATGCASARNSSTAVDMLDIQRRAPGRCPAGLASPVSW